MEAIKRHLQFDNKLQQIQAVHALHKLVAGRLTKISAIGFTSTHQVPELEFLLDLCCHGNPLISQTAQQCMMTLVTNKLVDVNGCTLSLLKYISSVQDLSSLLTLLASLMQLQISSIKVEEEHVHPLVKVYEMISNDKWQLLALTFSNTLSASDLSDGNVWKEMMLYHKVFIQKLLFNNSTKSSGLCTHVLYACLSYTDHLDYTIAYFIEILEKTQDLFCPDKILILDLLWQACIAGLKTISMETMSSLSQLSLTVCSTTSVSSHSLWRSMGKMANELSAVDGNHRLLASVLHQHMNTDSQDLKIILQIVKGSIVAATGLTIALLLLPLLELMSALSICKPSELSLISSAEECLMLIDSQLPCAREQPDQQYNTGQVPAGYLLKTGDPEHLLSPDLLCKILVDCESSLLYLCSVREQLEAGGTPSKLTVFIVPAILVATRSTRVQLAAIDTIKKLVVGEPTQCAGLFLLMIHWMKRSLHPDVMLSALLALPSFASHKYNLPAVIKYLMSLAACDTTRALSIRLLCDVASLQPKALPHLIQTIQTYQADTSNQVMIARAKAIYHICYLRPALYTAELIPDLNQVLSSHASQLDEVVSLAIQTLGILVEAEVLDMVSTWQVMSDHLDGTDNSRPLVVSSLCDFLALSSHFEEPLSPFHQEFQMTSICRLWEYTRDTNQVIVSSAFSALSTFPYETIKYSHLSQKTQQMFAADYVDHKDKYDGDLINGAALLNILTDLEGESLPGYETFLQALLRTEVDDLGVGLIRKGDASKPALPKAILTVPERLNSYFGSIKSKTGVGGSLANITVGMLSCQVTEKLEADVPHRRLRQMCAVSKQTCEQLTSFISDASSLSSSDDWLYNFQLLAGWVTYIRHVLMTVIAGRRAHLKISNQVSTCSDVDVLMVARDHVEATISSSARQGVVSQSNALMALSSLCLVVREQLVKDAVGGTSVPSSFHKWEQNLLHGLMSTSLGQRNRVYLPWLTQIDDPLIVNTSLLCLSMLPYAVYQSNETSLLSVLKLLQETAQAQGRGGDTASNAAISLGSVLAKLIKHDYQDIGDWQIINKMDECVQHLFLDGILQQKLDGCTLGLLNLVPVLHADSKYTSLVQEMYEQFRGRTELCEGSNHVDWYARGALAAHLHSLNKWSGEINVEVESLLLHLSQGKRAHLGASVLVASLALDYHSLSARWINSLQDLLLQDGALLPKLRSEESARGVDTITLQALYHLTGANLVQNGETMLNPLNISVAEKLVNMVLSSDNPNIWMATSIHHTLQSASLNLSGRSTAQTYKHILPNSSVLRHTIDCLHSFSKATIELTNQQLAVLLRCVTHAAERRQLPSLQWSALLAPMMRLRMGEELQGEVQSLCIRTAASQCKGCPLSTAFISKWSSPQLYNTLTTEGQSCMLDSLDRYVDQMRKERLVIFRDQCWLPTLVQEYNRRKHSVSVLLDSMHRVVKSASHYAPSTTIFVYETLNKLCQGLSYQSSHYVELIDGLCRCLGESEKTLSTDILTNLSNDTTALHLVSRLLNKTANLHLLVPLIESVAQTSDREWLLSLTFSSWKALTNDQAMEFIVQLQQLTLKSQDPQYVDLWLQVLCCAVINWSHGRLQLTEVDRLLPFYLQRLMGQAPWSQLKNQTLSWMTSMKMQI